MKSFPEIITERLLLIQIIDSDLENIYRGLSLWHFNKRCKKCDRKIKYDHYNILIILSISFFISFVIVSLISIIIKSTFITETVRDFNTEIVIKVPFLNYYGFFQMLFSFLLIFILMEWISKKLNLSMFKKWE